MQCLLFPCEGSVLPGEQRRARSGLSSIALFLGLAFTVVACRFASAQDAEDAFLSIPWQEGPTVGEMGPYAQITVPEGFLFTGPEGTPKFLELTENPPDPKTVGVLYPLDESATWVVYFDYDDSGHVKDDDRDQIDADALLEAIKDGNEAANVERRKRGWEGLVAEGWVVPPHYEQASNRLAWGIRLRTDSGETNANYEVRVLGRTGVMSVVLACAAEEVTSLIPVLQGLLAGFEFQPGHRYGEWREGDKLAEYGLTGLIAGGTLVAAAKSGLLAKLAAMFAKAGKLIVVVVVAVLGGIWRLLTGGKAAASDSSSS